MVLRHNFQAVYVINQDVDLSWLVSHIDSNGYSRVVLITTHALLAHELSHLKESLQVEPYYRTFASFLSDEEMASVDNSANSLASSQRTFSLGTYLKEGMKHKNRLVASKVQSQFDIGKVYCADGLGISFEAWSNQIGQVESLTQSGSLVIDAKLGCTTTSLLRRVKRFFKLERVAFVFAPKQTYLFYGGVKRVRLSDGLKVIHCHLPFWILFLRPLFGRKMKLASSIHCYDQVLNKVSQNCYVFVDGFHPPNYTRSYIDYYLESTFVPKSFIDYQWFFNFNKKAVACFDVVEKEYFPAVDEIKYVQTVVLALNHAGDWSSLINRSDTDELISAFCRLAQVNKRVDFIIRLHPTMAHPEHEGLDSMVRISSLIDYLKIDNLYISDVSLEEDLQRGDLFITEYSNVVIEAFSLGKLGLIANLTNRRSYMSCFEEIGFPLVSSEDDLKIEFERFSTDIEFCLARQRSAIAEYNKLQKMFYLGLDEAE